MKLEEALPHIRAGKKFKYRGPAGAPYWSDWLTAESICPWRISKLLECEFELQKTKEEAEKEFIQETRKKIEETLQEMLKYLGTYDSP